MQKLSEALGEAKIRVEGCSSFLKAAIKWSVEFGAHRNGSLELHDMLAEYIYSESPEVVETVQAPVKNQEFDRYNASHSDGTVNVNYSAQTQENNDDFAISTGATGRNVFGIITDQSVAFHPQAETNGNSSQPSQYGLEETHLKHNDSHLKDFTFGSPTSHVTVANVSLENSGSFLLHYNYGYSRPLPTGLTLSSYEDSIQPSTKITESYFQVGQNIHAVTESTNTVISDMGERNSLSHFRSGNSTPSWPSESPSTAFSFDGRSSSSHVPLYPAVAEISTRRSRPSFLDSINMPKVPLTEPGRVESSKFSDRDAVASSAFETSFTETETIHPFSKLRYPNVASAFEHSMTSTVSARNGDDMYGHTFNENMDRRHDSYSRKQDEDFAALEQVYLYGGQVTSWKNDHGEELLFVSSKRLRSGGNCFVAAQAVGRHQRRYLMMFQLVMWCSFCPKAIYPPFSVCL